MKLPSPSQLQKEITQLTEQMSDPVVSINPQKVKQLARQHREKAQLLALVERYQQVSVQHKEARELSDSEDAELAKLAEDDLEKLGREKNKLKSEIEELFLPRDSRDDRDVIIEIRAGAGGDEASLFVGELFRAYTRFAENKGWTMHLISSSPGEIGGFKEVVAELTGENVFGIFKYERGVHRVQRVPETEKQGRIHTSTITIAVMPQAEEIDIEVKPEDLRIDTYRASGAGGQHVNKTSSAIRITHLPTNTVVAVQEERSQHKNREKAMKILRSRLLEDEEEKRQAAEASERREQVGTGDRSEKIRTYNYPQDRITDHRIKESWSNIPSVMEGNLEPLFKALLDADRALRLKKLNKDNSSS